MYQPRLKLLSGTIIDLFIIIIFSCVLCHAIIPRTELYPKLRRTICLMKSRFTLLYHGNSDESHEIWLFFRRFFFFFIGNSFPFLTFKTTTNIWTTVVVVGDWLLIRHGDTELKGRETRKCNIYLSYLHSRSAGKRQELAGCRFLVGSICLHKSARRVSLGLKI